MREIIEKSKDEKEEENEIQKNKENGFGGDNKMFVMTCAGSDYDKSW